MKRLLAFLALVTVAHGAGTVQQSIQQLGQTNNWVLAFTWTGDASNGTVPTTAGQGLNCCTGYLVVQVETTPGSPQPTAGYGVAIQDSSGVDVLNGAAGTLSASASQSFAASTSAPPLQGVLTLVITGQNVASAKGTVYVFLSKPGSINVATLGRGAIASSSNWLTLSNSPFFDARTYNFTPQSPGGSLSIGANTVTLSPCPLGLNGTDVSHNIYISGGTGAAEAVLITGGTCLSGAASGTVSFSAVNTHTGAWTISSAAAGIQEAVQAAQTTGGGTVIAGGGSALVANGNIIISGSNITLQIQGAGINLVGTSIVMNNGGINNAIMGIGYPKITATTTAGDIITLAGCNDCRLSGLDLERSATPAISGVGIDILMNDNNRLRVNDIKIIHQFKGIWAQVAPVASSWVGLDIEHSVQQGIEFDSDNDEQFNNILVDTSGGNAIQVGKGVGTTNCVGGFRMNNTVTFNNGGDGLHIGGASGVAGISCVFILITNSHFDSDAGFELFLQFAGSGVISNTEFVNGKGGLIEDSVSNFQISGCRFGGSSSNGLYITNGAQRINLSGVNIQDAAATFSELLMDQGVNTINMSGTSIGAPNVPTAFGIQIATTGSAPTAVHMTGTQLFNTGNMTTPVSIASGLTDVFVDNLNYFALTPTNSWTVNTATACRLENNGYTVRVKGTIAAGTTTDGTAIFTLPVGCRPPVTVANSVISINGSGNPNGVCEVSTANTGVSTIFGCNALTPSFLRLDGISFTVN